MTELSPAALAVLNAVIYQWNADRCPISSSLAAAALRAVADQLGEEIAVLSEGFKGVTRDCMSVIHVSDLLDIAAELEAHQ